MILVTGATGFLGSELVLQLTAKGHRLRALKRENGVIPALLAGNPLVEWAVADLNEPAALEDAFEGVTRVYHCAALVSFDPADKYRMLKVNIEGTANIVTLCRHFGARLLHVSSVAALGEPKKGMEITEADFWEYDARAHSYAISKYEGEMEVWRGLAEGLDALIVNPSVIIGKNAGYSGSGAIFKLVREGLSWYTGGASGFVDVQDTAACMILLMDSNISGERYTLSAENYHYQQFFSEIASGFGLKAPSRQAKPWMLELAWPAAKLAALFTGKAPALTRDAARSSLNISLYSNAKIIKDTGFTFKPLHQTIQETCAGLNTLK